MKIIRVLRSLFIRLLSVSLIGGCAHPTSEKFVEVNVAGHRIHLLVIGDDHAGKPTVILESGMGGGVGWNHVRDEIARFAQVVTYDRAGTGQSEPGPAPRDANAIAGELHAALGSAGVKPPYVLVGQSLGGLYVQAFAARYPEDTGGLVLVDPTHANAALNLSMNEVEQWYSAHQPDDWPRVMAACGRRSPEPLASFLACKYKLMEEFFETLPEPRRSAMRAEWWAMIDKILGDRPPPQLHGGESEEAAVITDSIRQAIAARPLPKVPTYLLAAGRIDLDAIPADAVTPNVLALQTEARRWKMAAFQEWIDHTPGGELILVRDSGHDIESERPQAVIDAVRKVTQRAGTVGTLRGGQNQNAW